MNKILITLSLCFYWTTSNAQPSKIKIHNNPLLAVNGYYAYPGSFEPQLTPAPKGYVPFHISHYGRYGSRYLIDPNDYDDPFRMLQQTDSLGKLIPTGKEVLRKVTLICNESKGRLGELILRGAEQHQQIVRRIFERFPEVLGGKANVDARSSTAIRCILSMESVLQQLAGLNPQPHTMYDVSTHDMPYLVYDDTILYKNKMPGKVKDIYKAFVKRHDSHMGVMNRIFNDELYWRDSVNAADFSYQLYSLASNVQSIELRHQLSLLDLFTHDELYDTWLKTNAWWYINYGPPPLNGAVQPYSQRILSRRITIEADSCMIFPHPGATLRYGHDMMAMPLVCLLDINGYGKQTEDLERLDDENWLDYRIFPTACNLQFVFYRSQVRPHDILVKVPLNENEVALPLPTNIAPYYHWDKLKTYYLNKIDQFQTEK